MLTCLLCKTYFIKPSVISDAVAKQRTIMYKRQVRDVASRIASVTVCVANTRASIDYT